MARDEQRSAARNQGGGSGARGRDTLAPGPIPRLRPEIQSDLPAEAGGISPALVRTAVFLLGGAGMLLLGLYLQPRFIGRAVKPEEQRVLFPELSDASKAASLEVVKYDEDLATLNPFKVVQTGGVWVLPAHQNYPADAKDQLAAAATELVDLEVLAVVSTSPADHETYGVIEPDPEKLKPGMTGIGQLIKIRDAAGLPLARLVVGKEDKRPLGAEGSGRVLRFVRKSDQDPVYRVEIDTSKFTTRFDDWIEKDLLKLSPWDVRRLVLDDYTLAAVETGGRVRVEQNRKNKIDLAYNDKDAKWSVVQLEGFAAGNEPKAEPLTDAEELAVGKLNDLRNALGDLKIVNVARKPSGFSAELKAEESFTNDPEAVTSMQQRGFLPLKSGDILSTDGETIVGMKDGVEYVLRFGAGTTVAGEGSEDSASGSEKKPEAGVETTGRYLLVMARFNESLLDKPQIDPLPEVPAGQPADATQPAPEGADKPAEGAAAEALKAADEAEVQAQAALEERRRVERENRRRQDDYEAKVKAAQKRVRDLNSRFADWYYVVSDKEYAKIHLNRSGIVQPQGAESASGPPAPPAGGL
ncbi:MAG: DUF4340 domain-containing protein [Planctomycetota bacterium]